MEQFENISKKKIWNGAIWEYIKKENLKWSNLRIYQKRKFEMEQFENVCLLLNFEYLGPNQHLPEYVNP